MTDLSNIRVGDTVHLRCGSWAVDEQFLRIAYTPDGRYVPNMEHPFDIISITPKPEPRRIKGWVNLYGDELWHSKESADMRAGTARKACIYIDVAEGQGL